MDLETLLSFEWGVMAPEFIILGVATLLSILDLFLPKKIDRRKLGWIGLIGIVLAVISLITLLDNETTSILDETFHLDEFAKVFKMLLLVGTGLIMLFAISYEPKEGMKEYRGEFYYLLLAALLGTMIMASSNDLITLFVGLELLSIASYILAGLRKKHLLSNESAMKYVINGGISTAITLFGFSYLYGITGTTNLIEMSELIYLLDSGSQYVYLLSLAFFMVFVGLSFKIAAAPFHMWAPDVYQGAPTPVTSFLGVISKTAGFVILIRVLYTVFSFVPSEEGAFILEVQNYLAFLAGATMIIGNVVALRQRNIKRLFAYSSIAHAGYLLVAVTAGAFIDIMWFYLVAYAFMTIGAFAVIQVMTEKSNSEDISHFAGLYRRSPLLAISMGVFILSLAGIPGTAGFIGKIKIFIATLSGEPLYVLAAVMIGTTVISYFYYFGIMTQMFFRPPEEHSKVKVQPVMIVVILICAAATIILGLAPNIAIDFLFKL
ncbi:NADH-quinone oxidoreductase subunit NuoN [Bacillus aquiflavi]|uniref:NADH-quinone oxidoreductase subunit N n=1 Tax=Bacillus aquiflavi TaxID=2672567 RepID=A0A6B3VZ39_9BACI|nr:NADH-quinone oxidoreductase subunit NuoN [Bacillus aquiflavi]MBA4536655.1 NADH-quinone oxidoreductase subunit NuoN [Bacillus aquiflavi]NEY81023.1 NADH-quinone oxidoreductase subunit NuoN [Bacillus aquiflavi]